MPIQFQSRDHAVLHGLFESRVMTTNHPTTLYFADKIHAANKRLQRLKAAGFIGERPRRAFDPSVLFLTRKGLLLLQEKGVLSKYPSFDLPALDRRARVSDLAPSTTAKRPRGRHSPQTSGQRSGDTSDKPPAKF
jgi:hypothetical protein